MATKKISPAIPAKTPYPAGAGTGPSVVRQWKNLPNAEQLARSLENIDTSLNILHKGVRTGLTVDVTDGATTVLPTLTGIAPSSGSPGQVVNVTLTGTGFLAGAATVSTDDTDISISAVLVVNDTTITATFTISSGAVTQVAANVAVTIGTDITGAVSFIIIPALVASWPGTPGQVGVAYSAPSIVSGGVTPYATFVLVSGTLPTGTALNASTGVISGTPTVAGSYAFTLRVTDAVGTSADFPGSVNILPAIVTAPNIVSASCAVTYERWANTTLAVFGGTITLPGALGALAVIEVYAVSPTGKDTQIARFDSGFTSGGTLTYSGTDIAMRQTSTAQTGWAEKFVCYTADGTPTPSPYTISPLTIAAATITAYSVSDSVAARWSDPAGGGALQAVTPNTISCSTYPQVITIWSVSPQYGQLWHKWYEVDGAATVINIGGKGTDTAIFPPTVATSEVVRFWAAIGAWGSDVNPSTLPVSVATHFDVTVAGPAAPGATDATLWHFTSATPTYNAGSGGASLYGWTITGKLPITASDSPDKFWAARLCRQTGKYVSGTWTPGGESPNTPSPTDPSTVVGDYAGPAAWYAAEDHADNVKGDPTTGIITWNNPNLWTVRSDGYPVSRYEIFIESRRSGGTWTQQNAWSSAAGVSTPGTNPYQELTVDQSRADIGDHIGTVTGLTAAEVANSAYQDSNGGLHMEVALSPAVSAAAFPVPVRCWIDYGDGAGWVIEGDQYADTATPTFIFGSPPQQTGLTIGGTIWVPVDPAKVNWRAACEANSRDGQPSGSAATCSFTVIAAQPTSHTAITSIQFVQNAITGDTITYALADVGVYYWIFNELDYTQPATSATIAGGDPYFKSSFCTVQLGYAVTGTCSISSGVNVALTSGTASVSDVGNLIHVGGALVRIASFADATHVTITPVSLNGTVVVNGSGQAYEIWRPAPADSVNGIQGQDDPDAQAQGYWGRRFTDGPPPSVLGATTAQFIGTPSWTIPPLTLPDGTANLYRTFRFWVFGVSRLADNEAGGTNTVTLQAGWTGVADHGDLSPSPQAAALDLTKSKASTLGAALGKEVGTGRLKVNIGSGAALAVDGSNNLYVPIASDFVVQVIGGVATLSVAFTNLAKAVGFDTAIFGGGSGSVLTINALAVNKLAAGDALFGGQATFATTGGGKLIINSTGVTIQNSITSPTSSVQVTSSAVTITNGQLTLNLNGVTTTIANVFSVAGFVGLKVLLNSSNFYAIVTPQSMGLYNNSDQLLASMDNATSGFSRGTVSCYNPANGNNVVLDPDNGIFYNGTRLNVP